MSKGCSNWIGSLFVLCMSWSVSASATMGGGLDETMFWQCRPADPDQSHYYVQVWGEASWAGVSLEMRLKARTNDGLRVIERMVHTEIAEDGELLAFHGTSNSMQASLWIERDERSYNVPGRLSIKPLGRIQLDSELLCDRSYPFAE